MGAGELWRMPVSKRKNRGGPREEPDRTYTLELLIGGEVSESEIELEHLSR